MTRAASAGMLSYSPTRIAGNQLARRNAPLRPAADDARKRLGDLLQRNERPLAPRLLDDDDPIGTTVPSAIKIRSPILPITAARKRDID